MEQRASVTLLGTRGSMPCSGKEYVRYGGSTTCILVQFAEETIVLDGGSGILRLNDKAAPSHLSLLLTHPHIDHMIGIPMCPLLMRKDVTLDLYAAPLGGLSAEQQFRSFVQPPLWPIVLATDCTYTEELLPSLIEFAKGCDLLLCDGLHSEEEWAACEDFGHNTWIAAAELGHSCGAKQVRIIHHSPDRSDDELDAAAAEVSARYPNCHFGYDEEVIAL